MELFSESDYKQPQNPKEHCWIIDGNTLFPMKDIYDGISPSNQNIKEADLLSFYTQLIQEDNPSWRTKLKLWSLKKTDIAETISKAISATKLPESIIDILEEKARNATYDIRFFMQAGVLTRRQILASFRGALNNNGIQRSDMHVSPVSANESIAQMLPSEIKHSSVTDCADAHIITMHPKAFQDISENITIHTVEVGTSIKNILQQIS